MSTGKTEEMMENMAQTSLFKGFEYFESLLPNFAKTGLFSPGAQQYAREQDGKMDARYRPRAEVVGRRNETTDTITLELTPPEGYPEFTPGQHIDVAVEIYGVRHIRQYSLTGLPGSKNLQITVKRQPGGLVSNFIYGTVYPKARLEISVPRGEFTMPSRDHSAYLFFSAGSGITPVYSIVRALLEADAWGDIYFFHAAKSRETVIFGEELKRLAAEHENFHPYFFFSESEGPEQRRLDAQSAVILLQNSVHPPHVPVFICGPGDFVQGLEKDLGAMQYSQIRTEYYTIPQTAAGEGTAMFLRSRVSVKAEANLLEAAEAAGLKPKHGCRRGICHECKAHKRSGTVKNLLSGKESSGREDIQLCITQPVGAVEIDL